MIDVPLVNSGNQDEASGFLFSRRINWYPEAGSSEGRSTSILRTAPGLMAFISGLSGPVRGVHDAGGVLYVVAGEVLYSVNGDGIPTTLGTVLGGGICSFTDGFVPNTSRYVAIGTGERGYIFDTGTGFAEITDPNFVGTVIPTTPIYMSGYLIWPTADGFLPSNLLAPSVYSAADFVTAESATDGVVGLNTTYGLLWVFGGRTIEVYSLSGDTTNTFTRQQTIEFGASAPLGTVVADNSPWWIDDQKRIFRASGYQAQRVSTHQVEQYLATVDCSAAYMFTFTDRGHEWICATVPGRTWMYDVATQVWSERQSQDLTQWRAIGGAQAYGLTLFGDTTTGTVYKLDAAAVSEGAFRLTRELYTAYLHKGSDPLAVAALQLTAQTGNALQVGTINQTAPVIEMRYSDDGGDNWSMWKQRSTGNIGQYLKRISWYALGSIGRKGRSAQRVFHFRISDPVRCDLIAASMDAS